MGSTSGGQFDTISKHSIDTSQDVLFPGAAGLHGEPEEEKQFLNKKLPISEYFQQNRHLLIDGQSVEHLESQREVGRVNQDTGLPVCCLWLS